MRPNGNRSYERGVSFDTFDNRNAAEFSLTLNYKHKGYRSRRRSRTYLCGTDQNEYSEFALEWLLDELVNDGDEIVCLRAVEKDSRVASDAAIEEGKYRKEAESLFEQVIQKNSRDEKAISLVLELAVGKIEEIIQRMVGPSRRTWSFPVSHGTDSDTRACYSGGRHTRPQSQRRPQSAAGLSLKVLRATLSHPRHSRPPVAQTREEKEQTPRRPGPPELQPHPRNERATWQPDFRRQLERGEQRLQTSG